MNAIGELLQQLNCGALSLTDARVHLARLAQSAGQDTRELIAGIHSAVASRELEHAAARALLDTIVNATQSTQLPRKISQTSIREPQSKGTDTVIHDSDKTVRSRKHTQATLIRPAGAESASDGRTLARSVPGDLEAELPHAAGTPADPERAITRTLRAPGQTIDSAPAARTLREPTDIPDKTLGMASRLVQSLDENVVHGELRQGTVIKHRFLLDTLIGKGGMGLVFSAIDRRKEEAHDPNPRVALKVLNADFQSHPLSFMALQREARKAQTLAHPNVVTVFDFDRDGDTVYMTMELLQGRPLETMVRQARGTGIGRDLALPIIRGIAEGLAYAHRKGIVHSDLKPGNVFITTDNTPKILDFGIARAVPNAQADETPDEFDAGSLGAYTEAYATNEMVNGIDPHPADDMYALGIIGYELLTGFHPFQRHSAPNARKLGITLAPLRGVKRKEARALERCLSFERHERPKDAGEFLKLFRGVSTLQKVSIAAATVLALVSGYFWYQNYLETSPAVPFDKLPAQTQQQFASLIEQGNEEWQFFEREHNLAALQSSVEQYSRAYQLHPRNHAAVRGLRRSADALLHAAKNDDERRQIAAFLQDQSDYYRKYAPVVDAAG